VNIEASARKEEGVRELMSKSIIDRLEALGFDGLNGKFNFIHREFGIIVKKVNSKAGGYRTVIEYKGERIYESHSVFDIERELSVLIDSIKEDL